MNMHTFMLIVLPIVAVVAILYLNGIYRGLSKN